VADSGRHHPDHEPVRERDRSQVVTAGGGDGTGADEHEREGTDEFGKPALESVRTHAQTLETKPDGAGGVTSRDGSGAGCGRHITWRINCGTKGDQMSAEILK